MATLVLKNKNRALRNDSCPVEFDPDTRIELTGFVIVSTRKYDTIYRKQNIRSPEKNVLTKKYDFFGKHRFSFLLFFLLPKKKPFNPFLTLLITLGLKETN